MKIILTFAAILLVSCGVMAQDTAENIPPYKRYPTVPPIRLLLLDSTTWLTKEKLPAKKPLLLILFSPDCEHCKLETEDIIKNYDKFKKIIIIMATTLPFEKMKEFYKFYDLHRFPNIAVGRDVDYLIPIFYGVRNMPYLAMYDKKGKLIDVSEGSLPVEKILEKFEAAK